MKYQYFISFCCHNGQCTGYGNDVYDLDYPINNIEDVRKAELMIEKLVVWRGMHNVKIMFWKLMDFKTIDKIESASI